MPETIFKNKKLSLGKLVLLDFVTDNNIYTYTTDIADGLFMMTAIVRDDSTVSAQVVESSSKEA